MCEYSEYVQVGKEWTSSRRVHLLIRKLSTHASYKNKLWKSFGFRLTVAPIPGELLSPASLDAMDEVVVVCEEAGASSSSAVADSEDSLSQPASIPLVESIDEALVPDIIAGTTGTSSEFQSAWVTQQHTGNPTRSVITVSWFWSHFPLFE